MFLDEIAPAWHGDLRSVAQKTQSRFDEDGSGEIGSSDHDHWACGVGQHVTKHDAQIGVSKRLRCFDVFLFSQGNELPANHPSDVHPHGQSDGNEYLPKAFPESQGNGQDHQQGGQGPNHLYEPTDHRIDLPSTIACPSTQKNTDEQGNKDSDCADAQADSRSSHQATEVVSSIAVGA